MPAGGRSGWPRLGIRGLASHPAASAVVRGIIPDPRTDQNMMVSGLHCAVILFHNKVVDYVRQQEGLIDPAAV